MDSAPLVSIVIVNYNGAQLLQQCLQSLQKCRMQNAECRMPDEGGKQKVESRNTTEVIVVENGSSDNSLAILKQFPWIKVIQSTENRGFAGGNNLGLTQCRGKYVLLLNNDTIVPQPAMTKRAGYDSPSPGGEGRAEGEITFLETLVNYFEQNPAIGVIQGKMILPRYGNTLDVCGSFLTAVGLPYHYGYFKPDGPKYQRSYPIFSGKGACLMFRRDIIERVGGFLFDEDFFCYYEESDFCHRAWLAGYEVHFVPCPPIQHLMGATSGDPQSAFVLRHYLRNMAFSLLSNLSFGSRLRMMPLFFAVLCASMAGAALKLQWPRFAAHLGAITYCISRYGKVRQRRRLAKSIRRQTDPDIFAKVLRTPRLEYFLKTFRGRIGEYVDEEVWEDRRGTGK